MSHIPSSAMKHAHAASEPHGETAPRTPAPRPVEHRSTPVWVSVAAGVAGAVATGLLFSLRSSTPAKPRRKKRARKAKTA